MCSHYQSDFLSGHNMFKHKWQWIQTLQLVVNFVNGGKFILAFELLLFSDILTNLPSTNILFKPWESVNAKVGISVEWNKT